MTEHRRALRLVLGRLRLLNGLLLLGREHRAVVDRSRVSRCGCLHRGRRVRRVDHRRVRPAASSTRGTAGRLNDRTVSAAYRRRRAARTGATAGDDGTLPGRDGRSVVTWGDTDASASTTAGARAARGHAARATGTNTAAERRTFLPEDVTVSADPDPGAGVCARPGGYAARTTGCAAGSGSDGAATRSGCRDAAGTCLRSATGPGRTGCADRLRSRVARQGGASAASYAESRSAGSTGLAAHADAAYRAGDVGCGSAVQCRAFARDQPGLAACAKRRVAAGNAARSGRVSAQSRLAGETGLPTGNSAGLTTGCYSGLAAESAANLTASADRTANLTAGADCPADLSASTDTATQTTADCTASLNTDRTTEAATGTNRAANLTTSTNRAAETTADCTASLTTDRTTDLTTGTNRAANLTTDRTTDLTHRHRHRCHRQSRHRPDHQWPHQPDHRHQPHHRPDRQR